MNSGKSIFSQVVEVIHQQQFATGSSPARSPPDTILDEVSFNFPLAVDRSGKKFPGDISKALNIMRENDESLDAEGEANPGTDWFPSIIAAAGVQPGDSLDVVKQKTSALASQAAPATRGFWNWLIILQGFATITPLIWLVYQTAGIPIHFVADITCVSAIALVTAVWWARWHGMQQTWARARLVAEVCRSMLGLQECPRPIRPRSIRIIHALRGLEP